MRSDRLLQHLTPHPKLAPFCPPAGHGTSGSRSRGQITSKSKPPHQPQSSWETTRSLYTVTVPSCGTCRWTVLSRPSSRHLTSQCRALTSQQANYQNPTQRRRQADNTSNLYIKLNNNNFGTVLLVHTAFSSSLAGELFVCHSFFKLPIVAWQLGRFCYTASAKDCASINTPT